MLAFRGTLEPSFYAVSALSGPAPWTASGTACRYRHGIGKDLSGFTASGFELQHRSLRSILGKISEVTGTEDKEGESKNDSFVHKGIAKRAFSRSFTLSDDIIVKGADLKDGMLNIDLEKVIPEEKKPRLIPIGS